MNSFKRRTIVAALAIALAVALAAGIPWLYSGDSPQQGQGLGLGQGIALAAPPLQENTAFRGDEAGFSAYLNVGSLIQDMDDLADIATKCTELPVEMDQSHLFCQIKGLSATTISLYADVNGWLVAHLCPNCLANYAAVWSGDKFNPVFESPTGKLDTALERAVDARNGDYAALKPDTGYYHWLLKTATVLTIMTRTTDTAEGGFYFFNIPTSMDLLEVSVTAFGHSSRLTVALDGIGITSGFGPRTQAWVCRKPAAPIFRGKRCPDGVPLSVTHKVSNAALLGSAFYLLWTPEAGG